MANLTPDLLDKVYDCIKKMLDRGQAVALDSLEVMMEREHGAIDP